MQNRPVVGLKEDSAGVRSDFPFAETALFTSRRGDKSSAVAAPDLAHQHTDRREGGREEADGKLYPLDDEKDQNISCGIQIFSCSRLRAMLNCPLKLFSAPEAINPSPRALLHPGLSLPFAREPTETKVFVNAKIEH